MAKVGRPTKYKPEFCQTIIEIGEQGGWLCEMAEACDVHRSTFPEWEAAHPEFSAALMRAKQKAQAWFETVGRVGMTAERFNSSLWQKQMSARHPHEYTERRDLTSSDGSLTPQPGLDVSKLSTEALTEIMAAAKDATDTR